MDDKQINFRLILQGCKKSNSDSQKRLYQHFYGYGMTVALRYSKTKPEAEEILNDAFLKVFRNIEQYDISYSFKSWFRKVVVNTAVDSFRKNKKYYNTFSAIEPNVDSVIEEEFEITIGPSVNMLPIVQKLPPAYRMVFNLYVMEGYKHHEIAKLLNISVGASKSNLSRAKVKLKESWLKQNAKSKKPRGHG